MFSRGPRTGEPAPYSVRVAAPGAGRLLVARGEPVSITQERLAAPAFRGSPVIGLGLAFGLTGLLFSAYLRTSRRGRLLRVQAAALGGVLGVALVAKLLLLFTAVSPFVLPVGALALLLAALVDRSAGVGVGVAVALSVAALTPFDAPVGLVLAAQSLSAVLSLRSRRRTVDFLLAGAAAAGAASAAYVGIHFLYTAGLPTGELWRPAQSPLLASIVGGLLVGPLAVVARPLIERATGHIPKAKLVELADLSNPLLKQIASGSPGTWQHSLAMANMAEVAANAIGANALLVRVGAYYHDLGKSLQPQYYIENIGPGRESPHDALPPEVSADAIFSHVTEGVRLGRAHGLPEAVIDFMHSHHGDGLLEYFWSKCVESGNPKGLSEKHFRYPGVPPQTRETAILCICDAVEAASRTLKQPDGKAIETLVQRIVYGKLDRGQLDESGLSVADLRTLSATLVETLKHAHHVRIEYPWQREEKRVASADSQPTMAASPAAREARVSTEQLAIDNALDSADAPRPASSSGSLTVSLDKPPTPSEPALPPRGTPPPKRRTPTTTQRGRS
jgi:putative nucleotidyltransferase with HDIG domain